MEKNPADVLEEAADLLLIHGRCTGAGQRDDGRMCVRGAIQMAKGEDPFDVMGKGYMPAHRELEQYLGAHPEIHAEKYLQLNPAPVFVNMLAKGRWSAWLWNDDLDTTDDDVRDVLLLVAKDIRNGEQ